MNNYKKKNWKNANRDLQYLRIITFFFGILTVRRICQRMKENKKKYLKISRNICIKLIFIIMINIIKITKINNMEYI